MVLDLVRNEMGVATLGYCMNVETYNNKDMLLYLVKFGSHLYGTNTENSDTDYKGIYRPSMKNLALNRARKTISFTTGNDRSKNTAEDLDIELFSLPYWLELLEKGETIALDMLFSFTNEDALVYKDSCMNLFFNHVDKLVDSDQVKTCAYIRYAKSQSVKYGLKGTRMKALEKAIEFFNDKSEIHLDRLAWHMNGLVKYVDDLNYCDIKNTPTGDFVYLCGKMHQSTITVYEFMNRVDSCWREYGHRAKQAMENEGVDWKAVSHCMRAIYQTQDLLEHGTITYPLKNADMVLRIKKGELAWPIVERMIEFGLEIIENMPVNFEAKWNQEFVDDAVLTIYDL